MMRHRMPQRERGGGGTPNRSDSLRRSSSTEFESKAAWEITSDEDENNSSSGGLSNVSMYNPLDYSTPGSVPAAPGSVPMTWGRYNDFRNTTIPAPNSLVGLRSSQLPSLAPAFIPDASYESYLLGRPLKKKQKSPIDKICCAKFCACFSWIAVMTLVFIGILIDTQPIFIQGVLPKHVQFSNEDRKQRIFYSTESSVRLEPASHAYQAAFVYFLTGCFSMAYAYNIGWGILQSTVLSRWRRDYDEIPDADSTVADFHGYRLPMINPASGGSTSPMMRAYQYNNRLSARIREMFTATKNRWKMRLATSWPQFSEPRRARRRRANPKDV